MMLPVSDLSCMPAILHWGKKVTGGTPHGVLPSGSSRPNQPRELDSKAWLLAPA